MFGGYLLIKDAILKVPYNAKYLPVCPDYNVSPSSNSLLAPLFRKCVLKTCSSTSVLLHGGTWVKEDCSLRNNLIKSTEREPVLLRHVTTQTLDGVGWLGHSSIPVMDLHLQARLHGPIQPVPHQEGSVLSVQRGRDVDADVFLLVQWTNLHFECVFT